MKRVLLHAAVLTLLAAAAVGGLLAWRMRPWRAAVSVNGHAMSARELDMRAQTLLDDARRVEHLVYAKGREREALDYYRREAAKMWIVKEVLLAEALARGYEASPADEKESLVQMAARLKSRNLTPEQFFKEGPIPEDVKRRDFREGVLISKFTAREVRDKISVTPKEIDERLAELKKADLALAGNGRRPTASRKAAIDSLRAERFREGFRALFRSLYVKAQVRCPDYPELETLDGVSPPRQGDKEQKK